VNRTKQAAIRNTQMRNSLLTVV